ncbi:unnamed protein product [Acanthoscelides obtectus]|nr:unnamed protein product [Acanthoscelides obtectus]CAK1669269.1 GRAM domain-containing protein 1B [Acanthoscelides obtectus]
MCFYCRSSGNFGSAGGARSAPGTPLEACPSSATALAASSSSAAPSAGSAASGSAADSPFAAQQSQQAGAPPPDLLIQPPPCAQSQSGASSVPVPSASATPATTPSGSCPPPSPGHQATFSKCDKASLKHLSTSTPVMTAQAQLSEPPSPKPVKEAKVHTTSKARQKKFLRHFPNVEEDEKVLNHYSCALIGDILLQGHLYITKNYFAFYSNVFGYVTKLLIPILTVENITKEKTARIIPNAVGIATSEDKHVFGSLISRDSTLHFMRAVWQKAKNASPVIIEPEIEEPDLDSSDSVDGESGRDSPPPDDLTATFPLVKLVKSTSTSPTESASCDSKDPRQTVSDRVCSLVKTIKETIVEFRKLPRQSLVLCATTLLLVLLFFSAGVLLYRISQIQNR